MCSCAQTPLAVPSPGRPGLARTESLNESRTEWNTFFAVIIETGPRQSGIEFSTLDKLRRYTDDVQGSGSNPLSLHIFLCWLLCRLNVERQLDQTTR